MEAFGIVYATKSMHGIQHYQLKCAHTLDEQSSAAHTFVEGAFESDCGTVAVGNVTVVLSNRTADRWTETLQRNSRVDVRGVVGIGCFVHWRSYVVSNHTTKSMFNRRDVFDYKTIYFVHSILISILMIFLKT